MTTTLGSLSRIFCYRAAIHYTEFLGGHSSRTLQLHSVYSTAVGAARMEAKAEAKDGAIGGGGGVGVADLAKGAKSLRHADAPQVQHRQPRESPKRKKHDVADAEQ